MVGCIDMNVTTLLYLAETDFALPAALLWRLNMKFYVGRLVSAAEFIARQSACHKL